MDFGTAVKYVLAVIGIMIAAGGIIFVLSGLVINILDKNSKQPKKEKIEEAKVIEKAEPLLLEDSKQETLVEESMQEDLLGDGIDMTLADQEKKAIESQRNELQERERVVEAAKESDIDVEDEEDINEIYQRMIAEINAEANEEPSEEESQYNQDPETFEEEVDEEAEIEEILNSFENFGHQENADETVKQVETEEEVAEIAQEEVTEEMEPAEEFVEANAEEQVAEEQDSEGEQTEVEPEQVYSEELSVLENATEASEIVEEEIAEDVQAEEVEETAQEEIVEETTAEEIVEEAIAEEIVEETIEETDEEKEDLKKLVEELRAQLQKEQEEKSALEKLIEDAKESEVLDAEPVEVLNERLTVLTERLAKAEKDLKGNKKEYLPLLRIKKTLENDKAKLRRKEAVVAKQKVVLFGVNNYVVDPEKEKKLSEDLDMLNALRLSVQHCEEVIKDNEDRYPILEKTYYILTKQIEDIKTDIADLKERIARANSNN